MRRLKDRIPCRETLSWPQMVNPIFFMALDGMAWNMHAGAMDILMRRNFPIWDPVPIPMPLHIGEQTPYDYPWQRVSGSMDNPRKAVLPHSTSPWSSRRLIL